MISATITIELWQALGALLVLVLGWGLKYLQAYWKDRRDREANRERNAALLSIAASNERIVTLQTEQIGRLGTVVEVNRTHHEEMIRTVREVCQATCPLKQRTI